MKDSKISKVTTDGKVRYLLRTEGGEFTAYEFNDTDIIENTRLDIVIGRAVKEGYNITNLQEFLKEEKGEA